MSKENIDPSESVARVIEAAKRFVGLYLESEHDGESWGSLAAADKRAGELMDAIDDYERHRLNEKPSR